ncbi:MAG: hypothetical protein U0787_07050 [Polyangia bacterium]
MDRTACRCFRKARLTAAPVAAGHEGTPDETAGQLEPLTLTLQGTSVIAAAYPPVSGERGDVRQRDQPSPGAIATSLSRQAQRGERYDGDADISYAQPEKRSKIRNLTSAHS